MQEMVCHRCGASNLVSIGSHFVCSYCGTKYSLSPNEKLPNFSSFTDAPIQGISLETDIEQLLLQCRNDPKNAIRYANLILDIDPGNNEAIKILGGQ